MKNIKNFIKLSFIVAVVTMSPFSMAQTEKVALLELLAPPNNNTRIIKIDKDDFARKVLNGREMEAQRREQTRLEIERSYKERKKNIHNYNKLNNQLRDKEQELSLKKLEEARLQKELLASKKLAEAEAIAIKNAEQERQNILRAQEEVLEFERKKKAEIAQAQKEQEQRLLAEKQKSVEEKKAQQILEKKEQELNSASIAKQSTSEEINALKKQILEQKTLIEKNNKLLEDLSSKLNDPEIKEKLKNMENKPEKIKIY